MFSSLARLGPQVCCGYCRFSGVAMSRAGWSINLMVVPPWVMVQIRDSTFSDIAVLLALSLLCRLSNTEPNSEFPDNASTKTLQRYIAGSLPTAKRPLFRLASSNDASRLTYPAWPPICHLGRAEAHTYSPLPAFIGSTLNTKVIASSIAGCICTATRGAPRRVSRDDRLRAAPQSGSRLSLTHDALLD